MKRMRLALGLTVVLWGVGVQAQGEPDRGLRHQLLRLVVFEGHERWNTVPSQVSGVDDLLAPAIVLPEAARELPQDLRGIELGALARDPTMVAIGVDLEHTPTGTYLYAQSFTIQDVSNGLYHARMLSLDPADAPPGGNGRNRIAAPDPVGGRFIIPAPAPVLLGAWGVLVAGWLRRRRWL